MVLLDCSPDGGMQHYYLDQCAPAVPVALVQVILHIANSPAQSLHQCEPPADPKALPHTEACPVEQWSLQNLLMVCCGGPSRHCYERSMAAQATME